MSQKLIKIKEDHYVVVDDSPKTKNFCIPIGTKYLDDTHAIREAVTEDIDYWASRKDYYIITHSTQPLEHGTEPFADGVQYVKIYYKIKPISLQEVKELIGEVDVEKKALAFAEAESYGKLNGDLWKGFLFGYNQALADNKDKKYTEEDVISIVKKSRETGLTAEYLLLSIQPKTEWEVEIVDGKLKLKL